eukprot:TRINITY_DN4577_c0_g2_i1.p1 TRINITY_DN4577_c0_g2~~TRINITY_DN4577_c0_g2_i1.p1  ORF type:complete len:225 (+),score=48.27 TRINITY_DN4577_c0_g2_i1:37-675(+)
MGKERILPRRDRWRLSMGRDILPRLTPENVNSFVAEDTTAATIESSKLEPKVAEVITAKYQVVRLKRTCLFSCPGCVAAAKRAAMEALEEEDEDEFDEPQGNKGRNAKVPTSDPVSVTTVMVRRVKEGEAKAPRPILCVQCFAAIVRQVQLAYKKTKAALVKKAGKGSEEPKRQPVKKAKKDSAQKAAARTETARMRRKETRQREFGAARRS